MQVLEGTVAPACLEDPLHRPNSGTINVMIQLIFVFLYILEILETPVPVISYQSNSPDSALQFLCEDGNPEKPRYMSPKAK